MNMDIINTLLQDIDIDADKTILKQIKIILAENPLAINDRSNGGSTPLILASCRGYTECFSFLLQSGADLFAKDDYGATAKFCAENNYRLDILKIINSTEK